MRKQWIGTGAIRRQIPPSKPKCKITNIKLQCITNKTKWNKKQMANRVGSYFPKGGHSGTQTELKI